MLVYYEREHLEYLSKKLETECINYHFIMAGHEFVVVKDVLIMETVVFWPCHNGFTMENNYFGVNSAMSIIICARWLILIT